MNLQFFKMKKLDHWLMPFAVFLFISCVSSLYPLSENEEEFVLKKELLGHWEAVHNNKEYIIDTADKNIYRIIVINKDSIFHNPRYNDTSYYLAFLINVQGQYFMDCYPDIEKPAFFQMGEEARNGFLLSHFIYNIRNIEQNSIIVSAINKDSLTNLIKKGTLSIKHEMVNDAHIVLREKPATLQLKLSSPIQHISFFDEPTLLKRKN